MAKTRISIQTMDEPALVTVEQPGEKLHERQVVANSGYEFEVNQGSTIMVGSLPVTQINKDASGQRPSPLGKPHPGQTSNTSELQPETDDVTAKREAGELPYDADIESPFATDRKKPVHVDDLPKVDVGNPETSKPEGKDADTALDDAHEDGDTKTRKGKKG